MSESDQRLLVPVKVRYEPNWLTWVASTTACLRALAVDCDPTDVAGMSGYAFHIAVHPQLCPSGPTVLDWSGLEPGIRALGRSTVQFSSFECHTRDNRSDRSRAHCRATFELVRNEIEAGRPCVLWGAYVPEFAAVHGIEGDAYLVSSFRGAMKLEEPPVSFDAVEAPGGPHALGFPTATDYPPQRKDRPAVARAIRHSLESIGWEPYEHGIRAFDAWAAALEAKRAIRFGNAYNAACYAEARAHASEFVFRAAKRHPVVSTALTAAGSSYGAVVEALQGLVELFPFRGPQEQGVVDDRKAIGQAVTLLRTAKEAEISAVESLREALRTLDWEQT